MSLPEWWPSDKPYIIGDCLGGMKELPGDVIDLTVTSPPYDDLRTYGGYSFDFEGIAEELFRITKPGGVVVWVVGDETKDGTESGTSFKQALYFKEIGFNLHDTMIYNKNGYSNPSNTRYHQFFEYMFILSKGAPKTFNPIKDVKTKYSGGGKASRKRDGSMGSVGKSKKYNRFAMRGNVWIIKTGKGVQTEDDFAFEHPAIFPDALAKDHILSWSNEGDIVLDPFGGSGTTPKMAKFTNRIGLCYELNPEWEPLIKKRMREDIKPLEGYF